MITLSLDDFRFESEVISNAYPIANGPVETLKLYDEPGHPENQTYHEPIKHEVVTSFSNGGQ